MMQVTHHELMEALKPNYLGDLQNFFFEIFTDSRTPIENGLFWALRGEKFDGHDFIHDVLKQGVKGVVTSQKVLPDWVTQYPRVSFYQVKDTLVALQTLAKFRSQQLAKSGAKVIGITGSNGKTTCKEFTAQIAEYLGKRVHSNKGSFNNHFGVPFNILSAAQDTQVLICEMGMNHKGELTELSGIVQPQIVCCTMVGTAHIENFGSIDKIAQAKNEIYQANPHALGVFNLSNKWTYEMAAQWTGERIEFVEAGNSEPFNESCDISMRANVSKNSFLEVSGHIRGVYGFQRIPIFGRHHITNIMAAIGLNLAIGGEPQKIWSALSHLKTPWGRTQLIQTRSGATLLFDAYNANPESMKALFGIVQEYPIEGRIWALLGEMKELGDKRESLHFELGQHLGRLNLAHVVFVGDSANEVKRGYLEAGGLKENIIISSTYDESLAIQVGSMLKPNDFVVIKGSRSMQLERFVTFFQPISFEGKS
jgi:UDP-N-acetylmuramoyl-tripeptide--D-alanyl-D-alanine ligase